MQAHIIRDFQGVNVVNYHQAMQVVSLISPRCPILRSIIDTIKSPASSSFRDFAPERANISKDLFDDSA